MLGTGLVSTSKVGLTGLVRTRGWGWKMAVDKILTQRLESMRGTGHPSDSGKSTL